MHFGNLRCAPAAVRSLAVRFFCDEIRVIEHSQRTTSVTATRRIKQLYSGARSRPCNEWQREEMMDSAVRLYRQVDDASPFLINTLLKCCVHFAGEHHYDAV